MVYKDGLLDRLDHPVLDFFADRHVANVDDRKKAITVQNLLDMTSGLDWDQGFEGGKEQSLNDLERSSNWTQFILDRPMAHAPGEVFNYSNGNPDLLSAIITKLTGKLAEDYAREKLFGPLGITTLALGPRSPRSHDRERGRCPCCRATWRRSAICICATVNGREGDFFHPAGRMF